MLGMWDANRNGKFQKRELQRAHDILSRLLDEFGDREELTREQLAEIIKKQRSLRGGKAPEAKVDRPKRPQRPKRGEIQRERRENKLTEPSE